MPKPTLRCSFISTLAACWSVASAGVVPPLYAPVEDPEFRDIETRFWSSTTRQEATAAFHAGVALANERAGARHPSAGRIRLFLGQRLFSQGQFDHAYRQFSAEVAEFASLETKVELARMKATVELFHRAEPHVAVETLVQAVEEYRALQPLTRESCQFIQPHLVLLLTAHEQCGQFVHAANVALRAYLWLSPHTDATFRGWLLAKAAYYNELAGEFQTALDIVRRTFRDEPEWIGVSDHRARMRIAEYRLRAHLEVNFDRIGFLLAAATELQGTVPASRFMHMAGDVALGVLGEASALEFYREAVRMAERVPGCQEVNNIAAVDLAERCVGLAGGYLATDNVQLAEEAILRASRLTTASHVVEQVQTLRRVLQDRQLNR